jgi:hypothetical protein
LHRCCSRQTSSKNSRGALLSAYQTSLYHALGDLPEPKFIHRFF